MTFTRLTLGEPRLRGKVHGGPVEAPCVDNVETGPQLLDDPGFEKWESIHGRTEFPQTGSGRSLVWQSDGTVAAEWEYGGNVSPVYYHTDDGSNQAGDDAPWFVSTANPDTGTYHARTVMFSGATNLMPNIYMHCVETFDDPFFVRWHIWPTTANLTVDFSVRAMTPSLANGQPLIRLFIEGWDATLENFVNIGGFPDSNLLTTSYQTYARSVQVPSSDVSFLRLAVHAAVEQVSPAPTGDLTIDIDNLIFGQE